MTQGSRCRRRRFPASATCGIALCGTDADSCRHSRRGSSHATQEAGLNRDRVYLEALRAAAQQPHRWTNTLTTPEIALARLGDSAQLQRAWCRSLAMFSSWNVPLGLVGDIGGAFAARAMDTMLSQPARDRVTLRVPACARRARGTTSTPVNASTHSAERRHATLRFPSRAVLPRRLLDAPVVTSPPHWPATARRHRPSHVRSPNSRVGRTPSPARQTASSRWTVAQESSLGRRACADG